MKLKDINIPKEIIKEIGWNPDDRIIIKLCDVYNDDMTIKYKSLVIKKEKK